MLGMAVLPNDIIFVFTSNDVSASIVNTAIDMCAMYEYAVQLCNIYTVTLKEYGRINFNLKFSHLLRNNDQGLWLFILIKSQYRSENNNNNNICW